MTGFNTQVGGGEYRLQFETDNREHYELMQETARRCVGTGKPLTNANHIRAMSDEELAKLLVQDQVEAIKVVLGIETPPEIVATAEKRCMAWLCQPAKEE